MPLRLPRNIRMLDRHKGMVDHAGSMGGDTIAAARKELEDVLTIVNAHLRTATEESQREAQGGVGPE